MPLWNKSGLRPQHLNQAQKRNVVATPAGWVRKQNYVDVHGNARQKTSTLVAIGNLHDAVTMGDPDIVEVYVADETSLHVVFTEPITLAGDATAFTLTLSDVEDGNNSIEATSSTDKEDIVNANNTLVFTFTPEPGEYELEPQSLAGGSGAYSLYGGPTETVNTSISAAVAEAFGTYTIDE